MKRYFVISFITFLSLFSLSSCQESPDYKDTMKGNFNALVDIIDNRYCFFEEKEIDWQSLSSAYRELITDDTNFVELFYICSSLLDNLEDGHVNLSSRFDTSYYRKWWTDYPQDFNLRTLEESYLEFDWLTTSGIYYKELPEKVGYIYYPSFSVPISETSLDYILAILSECRGLIIDIRDNGGGMLTNINTLVGRFIDREITGGYILHKTGPGHDEFSDPYPIDYKPADSGHLRWSGPLAVLTNRSCFSAANSFVAVMKQLPQVVIIGAKTGGGGGLPFSSELPNGWSIRFSACPILDCDYQSIENGIEPTVSFECHSPEVALAEGRDDILEKALNYMNEKPLPDEDGYVIIGESY